MDLIANGFTIGKPAMMWRPEEKKVLAEALREIRLNPALISDKDLPRFIENHYLTFKGSDKKAHHVAKALRYINAGLPGWQPQDMFGASDGDVKQGTSSSPSLSPMPSSSSPIPLRIRSPSPSPSIKENSDSDSDSESDINDGEYVTKDSSSSDGKSSPKPIQLPRIPRPFFLDLSTPSSTKSSSVVRQPVSGTRYRRGAYSSQTTKVDSVNMLGEPVLLSMEDQRDREITNNLLISLIDTEIPSPAPRASSSSPGSPKSPRKKQQVSSVVPVIPPVRPGFTPHLFGFGRVSTTPRPSFPVAPQQPHQPHFGLVYHYLSPFTLHPSPFTLHPSPFTRHPSPFTLHSASFTLYLYRFAYSFFCLCCVRIVTTTTRVDGNE